MKNTISAVIAAVLSLTSFQSAFAKNNDVVSGSDRHYVKVTRDGDQVKFEECFKGANPECFRTIGRKTSYSVSELNSQHMKETLQAYGSIVADTGIVAVSIYTGGVGGALLFQGVSTTGGITGFLAEVVGSVVGGALGAGAGAVGSTTLVATVRALNPVEQFKQASTISKAVLADREDVQTKDMNKFIERLELVLEKL